MTDATHTGDAVVRPMRRHHINLLMPFEREMFGAEAWTRGGYLGELADRRTRTYVVAEGNDENQDVDEDAPFLGWAGIRVLGDEAEILTVGVVPSARRRHIGRQLLDALLDVAHDKGATDVYLEVRVDNAAARALYDRAGFAGVGVRRGYYDHGRVDALVMHRHGPKAVQR